MKSTAEVVKVRDAMAWIESTRDSSEGSVALSATTREGKPVMLSAHETRVLAERLVKLADSLDSLAEQRREDDDGPDPGPEPS